MLMSRAITIRLPTADYETLEGEARSLGMRPGTLAKVLLHGTLSRTEPTRSALAAGARTAALDRLVALSAGLRPVDALALLHASREDVGERAS